MFEEHRTMLNEGDRRVKFVRAPAKRTQLRPRRIAIARLGQALVAEGKRLIGAERQTAAMLARYRNCFFARQERGHGAGGFRLRARFHTALIKIGRIRFDRHAGSGKKHPPRLALRRQDERRVGKP
jgi:hypothetical protein